MAEYYRDVLKNIAIPQDQDVRDPRDKMKLHPLFGSVRVDNNKLSGTEADFKEIYEDNVPREIGITREILKNNKVLRGLANPARYLLDKNKALENIGVQLSREYAIRFQEFYNKGHTVSDARKKAKEVTLEKKRWLMKLHEDDFPTEITSSVLNRTRTRANLGMDS